MQSELLATFIDLMETSSFNRSAERLGVTQSTVSARVQALETALGRKLFTRSRAGTKATAAGQQFLPHARAMQQAWNEARRSVSDAGNFARSMRVGMQTDLASTHIGDWVVAFRKALPDTAFYIELDYSTQMCADVLSGELDMAVLFTPRHSPDIHYEPVGEVPYRMISTEASRLCDVKPERYIFANYAPTFDRAHREAMPGFAGAPISSGQNAAVCGLLASLGGSAYVLEESAREMVATGAYRYVEDAAAILQNVHFAVHVRHRHSHAHGRLLAIVRRTLSAGRR